MPTTIFADHALLPTGWHDNVLLESDASGCLIRVAPDSTPPAGAERIALAVPGMPNLHSHAFQRAMAGLAEYRADPSDSFWSWRTLMYGFAQKLTPPVLLAIASQLYIEMLKAGYTSVCEFHYLHHDRGGQPYADPAEMSEALVAAAQDAGIGLTLLPVLYRHSGFGAQPPLPEQARFIDSPQWLLGLLQRLQRVHPQHAGLRYGAAPHSLRAVGPDELRELAAGLHAWDPHAPLHIHAAEQTGEVERCLATLGARPVEWLLDNFACDARWCLVHATHMTDAETRALAACGAVAGICPTTEANLGDGIFNAAAYAEAGGVWGIGSDSHVSLDMREELRLVEYGQRLLQQRRNVLVGSAGPSVGGYLFRQSLAGGARAAARPVAGLAAGQRADLLALDPDHPDLYGKRGDAVLDSLIFCNHGASPIRDVLCGGRWVIRERRHAAEAAIGQSYRAALRALLDEETP